MCRRSRARILSLALVWILAIAMPTARAQDDATAAVRKSSQQAVEAFNAGKLDALAGMFLEKGELIDEAGVVYQGRAEISELFKHFFEQFPGAKLALEVESIRQVGPVAIEEGTRTISIDDGTVRSRFRYIGVWAKTDKGWQLASFRDFADDPPPTPNDYLQPLAFLVGDWVNEGTDGDVAISYQWSEDKNYLLGSFEFKSADGVARKSTQRIGWDAATEQIRSWLFDADGGFSEAVWTVINDGVLIRSESVNPDGSTASATMFISSKDKDHYTLEGSDRVVGGAEQEDFELNIVRRPPTPGK